MSICLTRTPLCCLLQGRGDVDSGQGVLDSGQLCSLSSWMR